MFCFPLATSSNEVSVNQFWNAVLIYHNRPHLVNRRLTGAVPVLFLKVNFKNDNINRLSEVFTRPAILYEVRKLKELTKDHISVDFVRNILQTHDKNVVLEQSDIEDFKKTEEDVYVSLRILLPRQQGAENCLEVVVLDKKSKVATFFAITEFDKKALAPHFAYDIEHVADGNVRVCVKEFEDAESASAEWLGDQLFSKIIKWAETSDEGTDFQESLSLVSIETYTEVYHRLKNKYGKRLVERYRFLRKGETLDYIAQECLGLNNVLFRASLTLKIWTENTDPLKFVYEDIAIAAYLISLWQRTNPDKKPTFVDLGCGNGLLVYILNEENFSGFGIDIRSRKIWSLYPKSTTLKVETITPSASFLFPETDWIIGNHSDELTPWIPVIAARSSYKTDFFLLPCCCYEFSGKKYQRMNTSMSVYTEYLMYVQGICNRSGFNIEVDKLRIPSTKRTCIVSFGRSYPSDGFQEVDKYITDMISARAGNSSASSWANNFQPRPATERVRNCTQLSKDLVNSIISQISQVLLEDISPVSKTDGISWNRGGAISLSNLVAKIRKEDLKQLKQEYGGFKTLIKNYPYIFEVIRDSVRFRIPPTLKDTNGKYKGKPCWFLKNHPNSCFHCDKMCAYKHSL